jgi:hypothetical protein
MSIHPNDYNLKQVLSESGDLYVPWFQRNYTWDEDNIDELFQDIFDEYSWENIVESARTRTVLRDYFMGAVMLCGQGDGRRMILDGQQRLTTLTMLLAWVLKKMSQHPALASLHTQGVNILRNQAEANRLELKKDAPAGSSDCDDTIYGQIMAGLGDNQELACEQDRFTPAGRTLMERQIFQTYLYLGMKLDELIADSQRCNYPPELALQRIYEVMTTKLIFVSIRTDDEDYAIKFFETLNARGEDLTPDDLVKNALFLRAGTDQAVRNEVIEGWDNFVQNLKDPKDRIDFLRFEWNSRHLFIGKSKIYRSYKSHFNSLNGRDAISAFCDEMVFQSEFYKQTLKASGSYEFCRGLSHLGAKICRPVMLATNHKFRLELPATRRARVYEVVRILESVMTRCAICERVTTALEKGFGEMARKIVNSSLPWPQLLLELREQLGEPAYRIPTDDEFRHRLQNAVLRPADLKKQKWRMFFATLDRHIASPTFIAVPQITQINLVNVSQGNQQLHESIGNVRVSLEGGSLNGATTINPPLAAQVPGHWSAATISAQKARVVEAALACWPL